MSETDKLIEEKVKIGKILKERRVLLEMTQTELALEIGKISPAYIAFIESGKRNISLCDFIKYCNVLRLKPSKFFKKINL